VVHEMYFLVLSSYAAPTVSHRSAAHREIVLIPTLFKKQRLDPVGAKANLPFFGAKHPVRGARPYFLQIVLRAVLLPPPAATTATIATTTTYSSPPSSSPPSSATVAKITPIPTYG
jgi:hypothetical protein